MAVIVTNDFPPNRGGIQRTMSLLAQELASRGERVIVVAPYVDGCNVYDAQHDFRVLRYSGKNRFVSLASMIGCTFLARLQDRDRLTIASMWFPGGLAACLIPRLLRGRFAVLAHGTEIAPSKGGVRRGLLRYVFSRAEVIFANSGFTRDLLIKAGVRGRIVVVYPGIDAVAIEPLRAEVPTILSVGRLIERKGFDTMIRALPAIIAAYPAVRYEIVGAGPQRADLKALAARLGVSANVAFLGSVTDDEMRAAYARAWVFALPVRAIGNDVEGFGLVYLEAALAQLPAIGGRNSGAQDAIVAGETGLLVDGTSSADTARAILSLLNDPDAARRMGVAGRDRVLERFSIADSAAALVNALKEPSAVV